MDVPVPTCTYCSGELPVAQVRGRRRLYCSDMCRKAAHRRREEDKHYIPARAMGKPPIVSDEAMKELTEMLGFDHRPPDDQALESIVIAYALAGLWLRLAVEARPQLAYRCEKLGTMLRDKLDQLF